MHNLDEHKMAVEQSSITNQIPVLLSSSLLLSLLPADIRPTFGTYIKKTIQIFQLSSRRMRKNEKRIHDKHYGIVNRKIKANHDKLTNNNNNNNS